MNTQPDAESSRRSLPEISRGELAAVSEHLPPLVAAINATGARRDAHTGVIMHGLLNNLTDDEKAVALAYLQAVTFYKFT